MSRVFSCWKCNRRLNVDDVEGEIKVVVYCPKCRCSNRIETQPAPSFRRGIEVKA